MRKLIAALGLIALAACGDSSTNPNTDSISGTYSLRTINGSSLPYTFSSGTSSTVVTSDAFTVAENGTWSEVISYRTNGQTGTDSDSGSWSRSGSSVNFYSNVYNNTAYAGSYANNSLSLSDGTYQFVFTR